MNELIRKELEEIEEMVAEATEYEEYKEKVYYLREGMIRLTGSFVKAALLSSLIGWTEHWLKTDNEVYKQIREAADNNDLNKIRRLKEQIRNGWFYKTYEDMSEEMLGTISKSTAERYCKEFEEKGFIWSRDPEEKATYRAKWYKANIDLIRDELNKLGFDLDYYKLKKSASQNGKSENTGVPAVESPKPQENRISQNGKPSHQNGKSSTQNGKHLLYLHTTNTSTSITENSMYVGNDAPGVLQRFAQAYKLTGYARQNLNELIEAYGELLVSEALERTILAEKDRPIAYMKGILKNWSEAGLESKEDIEEHERKFRENKQKKNGKQKKEEKLPKAVEMAENGQAQTQPVQPQDDEPLEAKQARIRAKLKLMNEKLENRKVDQPL